MEQVYPIYKKHKNSSLVIEFVGYNKGTVIVPKTLAEDSEPDPIGYYSTAWTEHTKTSVWIDYKAPIILQGIKYKTLKGL